MDFNELSTLKIKLRLKFKDDSEMGSYKLETNLFKFFVNWSRKSGRVCVVLVGVLFHFILLWKFLNHRLRVYFIGSGTCGERGPNRRVWQEVGSNCGMEPRKVKVGVVVVSKRREERVRDPTKVTVCRRRWD